MSANEAMNMWGIRFLESFACFDAALQQQRKTDMNWRPNQTSFGIFEYMTMIRYRNTFVRIVIHYVSKHEHNGTPE